MQEWRPLMGMARRVSNLENTMNQRISRSVRQSYMGYQGFRWQCLISDRLCYTLTAVSQLAVTSYLWSLLFWPCGSGNQTIFQQNNAKPHVTRRTRNSLTGCDILPWTAASPDLYPIERLWDLLGIDMNKEPLVQTRYDLPTAVNYLAKNFLKQPWMNSIACLAGLKPV